MSELVLSVPDETLMALQQNGLGAGDALKMVAAVKLYEMGRLSTGAAAELAGIPVPVFLARLADYGVNTFRQTEEDLLEDLQCA